MKVSSRQGLGPVALVVLVFLALQGDLVLQEGRVSPVAHEAQILFSSQSNPGVVETQLLAPGQAEMWCRGRIPSCSFPTFHNGSLQSQRSFLWSCGPVAEWPPAVLKPWPRRRQLQSHASCG